MDKKYIQENEIEIKYLRNQLTSEELEAFEVYLMDNPNAVEGLQLEAVILGEIEAAHKGSSINTLKSGTIFDKLFKRKNYAIPFSFLFAVILVSIGISAHLSPREFHLYSMRGNASAEPIFTLSTSQKIWPLSPKITLFAQLDSSAGKYFNGEIFRKVRTGSDVESIEIYEGLLASDLGEVAVPIAANSISSGSYVLKLTENQGGRLNTDKSRRFDFIIQ